VLEEGHETGEKGMDPKIIEELNQAWSTGFRRQQQMADEQARRQRGTWQARTECIRLGGVEVFVYNAPDGLWRIRCCEFPAQVHGLPISLPDWQAGGQARTTDVGLTLQTRTALPRDWRDRTFASLRDVTDFVTAALV
jgi:hypothetical protein